MEKQKIVNISIGVISGLSLITLIGGFFIITKVPSIKYKSFGKELINGKTIISWIGKIGGTDVNYIYEKGITSTGNTGTFNMYSYDISYDESIEKFKIYIRKGGVIVKNEIY